MDFLGSDWENLNGFKDLVSVRNDFELLNGFSLEHLNDKNDFKHLNDKDLIKDLNLEKTLDDLNVERSLNDSNVEKSVTDFNDLDLFYNDLEHFNDPNMDSTLELFADCNES